LNDWTILKGIREVPMSDFKTTGRHYSVRGTNRIEQLANQIKDSNTISPLIVVVDKEGPYILEGSTRIEALHIIGAKSFPAMVVVSQDD
jgi:ParB-like chromosome segregation protein Spo0J